MPGTKKLGVPAALATKNPTPGFRLVYAERSGRPQEFLSGFGGVSPKRRIDLLGAELLGLV